MNAPRRRAALPAQTLQPFLTLVTTTPKPTNESAPKMSHAQAPHAAQTSQVYRRHAEFQLADHAAMVHNALEAVRCLAISAHGAGVSPTGTPDDLGMVARSQFVDLLEIINDRLGAALEIEALRAST
jgi:hypothetical protein